MTGAEVIGAEADKSTLWAAARADPGHLPELALMRVLPVISPGIHTWARALEGAASTPTDRLARRSVRRATTLAGWAGVITGTSFYVGMAPAIAVIYLEQLSVVLRVAAVFGHDPRCAARAAELLVIQGRYATVQEAEAAIRSATTKQDRVATADAPEESRSLMCQALSMIGLQLRVVRRPLDALVLVAEVLSFVVPIIGIPVWAYVNKRTTRRLGETAVRLYEQGGAEAVRPTGVTLAPAPTRRARRRLVGGVIAVGIALAALALVIPLGRLSHSLPLAGRGLAELGLLFTVSRLVRMVGPTSSDRPVRH
jgi:EcsC protein family